MRATAIITTLALSLCSEVLCADKINTWWPDDRGCQIRFNTTNWNTCSTRGHGAFGDGDKYCSRSKPGAFVCGIRIHANGTKQHHTSALSSSSGPYDDGVKGMRLAWCDGTLGPFMGNKVDSDQEHYYWWNTTVDDPIVHVQGTSDDKVQMLQFTTLAGNRSPQWGHHGAEGGKRTVWNHSLGRGLTGIYGSSGDILNAVSFKYRCNDDEVVPPSAPPELRYGDVAYSLELQPCGSTSGSQSWKFSHPLQKKGSVSTPSPNSPIGAVCLTDVSASSQPTPKTACHLETPHGGKEGLAYQCILGKSYGCDPVNGSMWTSGACKGLFTCNGQPKVNCVSQFGGPGGKKTHCKCPGPKQTHANPQKIVAEAAVMVCNESDPRQQWVMQDGLLRSELSSLCLDENMGMRSCNETEATGAAREQTSGRRRSKPPVPTPAPPAPLLNLTHEFLGMPLNMLRTRADARVPVTSGKNPPKLPPADVRCLTAEPAPWMWNGQEFTDNPGSENTCMTVTELIPLIGLAHYGPVKSHGLDIYLYDLEVQIPLAGKFDTCGLYAKNDPMTLKQGTLVMALDMPRVPFYVNDVNIPHAPFGIHCTLQTEGYTRAKIELELSYNLDFNSTGFPLSLKCDSLDFNLPEQLLEMFGGEICHGIADNMRGDMYDMVNSMITGMVKKALKKHNICQPTMTPVTFPECKSEAHAGPAAFITCAAQSLAAKVQPLLNEAGKLMLEAE
jgi:hypothetical protein